MSIGYMRLNKSQASKMRTGPVKHPDIFFDQYELSVSLDSKQVGARLSNIQLKFNDKDDPSDRMEVSLFYNLINTELVEISNPKNRDGLFEIIREYIVKDGLLNKNFIQNLLKDYRLQNQIKGSNKDVRDFIDHNRNFQLGYHEKTGHFILQ